MVDLGRFELPTPWLQNTRGLCILLARLASSPVLMVGFAGYSGDFVP
jgi:hypothetical protein